MIELTVRLVASLAIVVGLLMVTVRMGARKFKPRAGTPLRIVHRQALSRSSSIAVVEVGSRILVLGTTEHQVNVLAELDEDELSDAAELTEVIDMDAVRRPDVTSAPAPTAPAKRRASRTQNTPSAGGARRRPGAHASKPESRLVAGDGPLAGSVLSPQTWRQAMAVATGRA